jgi:putative Ca2+/H+ antiporter (TMEM165/GDT1 family)
VLFSPLLVGTAFVLVLPAELPDKTMLATLLLTARYRPWPVLVGVSGAFAVQVVIAVAFGSVLSLLPQQAVAAVVAVLFGIGAAILLREGFRATPGEAGPAPATAPRSPARSASRASPSACSSPRSGATPRSSPSRR